ncbi:Hint domain-containing protein [Spirillospora sp. NBC_00431]
MTDTITGSGPENLVHITVDTEGEKGTKTGTVTATDGHPFWTPRGKQWHKAADLKPGMWLRTSAGTHVQITAITRETKQTQVYNLTVDRTHTYYAAAGAVSVLVHNCGVTELYRFSPVERGASELKHGLNPAHFPSVAEDGEILTGAAHFGNLARVNDFMLTHQRTHGQGFMVRVPTKWIRDNEIEIWPGMGDQLEYLIPRRLMPEFNEKFPRHPWPPPKKP